MSFNINNYKEISGNVKAICTILTHNLCKTLKLLHLSLTAKSKKRLRLPLVDSTGLSPLFMVKINNSLNRLTEVAGIAYLNCGNKTTYNPSYSEELRA